MTRPSCLVTDDAQSWVFATSFTGGNLTQIDAASSRVTAVKTVGMAGLGRPAVSSDGVQIFLPDDRQKSIVAFNAASLVSSIPFNFTDPVHALAVGKATIEENVATPTPTSRATHFPATSTPTPQPFNNQGNWGTPTPFYIPLPIPPKISPVALGANPGIFGIKPLFEPIIINSITPERRDLHNSDLHCHSLGPGRHHLHHDVQEGR